MRAALDRMAGHLTAPYAPGADRLDLPFRAGSGTLADYDFAEHRAAFGTEPKPRYIVRALRPVPEATTLTVHYLVRDISSAVDIPVPAGTAPGATFAVPLGAEARLAVLRSVEVTPDAGDVAASWRVTALLGDLAALLWALSVERDALTGELARVRRQRTLAGAAGRSLDLIGSDLNVRRFPPLPYAFEQDTVALLHLDDAEGAATVADAMTLYRGSGGHPGTVNGARLGAVGRFGTGARFAGSAQITMANHAEFAATGDLTVECFLHPYSIAVNVPVLTKQAEPLSSGPPGWALSVGSFGRGIDGNVRFQLSDGSRAITLFADVTLTTGRFHHLAGVLNRAKGTATLYVDGAPMAVRSVDALGPLTNAEPVRIGLVTATRDNALHGVVDEVRISNAARQGFAPVLGESDASYRRRLTIFRRWTLPTPANLQAAVNDAAGAVAGVAEPFVLEDTQAPRVGSSRTIMVRPVTLEPDESVDALGRRGTEEAGGDTEFDPLVLLDVTATGVSFGPKGPGGADPRRMRVATRRALLKLRDLLDDEPTGGFPLTVTAGFDPAADDLRQVGRALVLRHERVAPGRLAALAHRAGFSWVQHRGASKDAYVSVTGTESVELVLEDEGDHPSGIDMLRDLPAVINLNPQPPPGAQYRWSVVHHEHGRAQLVSRPDDPQCRLLPTNTGRLVVKVEVSRGGRRMSASRVLRVGFAELPPEVGVSADGRTDVKEPVIGDAHFLPSYPFPFFDLRLERPASRDCRLHPSAHPPLRRLLDLIGADGFPDKIMRLATAWRPEVPGLDSVGCALELTPTSTSVPLGRIGALAHAAGFDYVRVGVSRIRLAQRIGSPVMFQRPQGEGGLAVDVDDVEEGSAVRVGATPDPVASAAILAGNLLCLMNVFTSTVTVLDPASGTVLRGAPTGLLPTAIAASPDGTTVYTGHLATRPLSVISVATGQVVDTLPLALEEQRLGLAVRPGRPELLVLTDTALTALNTSTKVVRAAITLPAPAKKMAMDLDGQRVWIACEDKTVRAVTVDSMTIAAPVTLPGVPVDITVTSAAVLVTVESGQLCVVSKTTGAVTQFTDVGAKPTMLAVDQSALYVADEASGAIVVRGLDGKAGTRAPIPLAGRVTSLVAGNGRLYFTTASTPPLGSTVLTGAASAGVLNPVEPHPAPVHWPIGSGFGEVVRWTAQPAADAAVRLSHVTGNEVRMRADRAGPVLLTVRHLHRDRLPFTVRLRLNPELEARVRAGDRVVVHKDQYDRVMNVLSELHPLGVEIDTRALRERVLELRADLADPFPAYTYPSYRLHRQARLDRR
jgi:DNA-binding beta-propeller fold protein YncE